MWKIEGEKEGQKRSMCNTVLIDLLFLYHEFVSISTIFVKTIKNCSEIVVTIAIWK